MIGGVADTHTVLWYLFKNPKLSDRARRFMDDSASAGQDIAVSAISLDEIVYLIEKSRIPHEAYSALTAALADPDCVLKEAPLNADIVDALCCEEIPDMPDRIVAATALYFNVPVISRDSRIQSSNIPVIW